MGKPVNHATRIAVWTLLCIAGFGIPAVLLLSAGETPSQAPSLRSDSGNPKAVAAPMQQANIATREAEEGDPVREPAREPMSALAAPAKPTPPPDPDTLPKRWRLVHQPVATAAGVLDIEGVTVVLPGLDSVLVNETCTDASGTEWPCGMGARTAFRAYLRGRSLNCKLPDQRSNDAILGECLLQGDDPAAWLVKNGWARAKLGGPYSSLEADARASRRGIYGSRPR
jgi:endonuclease YncB( thermonuclease family)